MEILATFAREILTVNDITFKQGGRVTVYGSDSNKKIHSEVINNSEVYNNDGIPIFRFDRINSTTKLREAFNEGKIFMVLMSDNTIKFFDHKISSLC